MEETGNPGDHTNKMLDVTSADNSQAQTTSVQDTTTETLRDDIISTTEYSYPTQHLSNSSSQSLLDEVPATFSDITQQRDTNTTTGQLTTPQIFMSVPSLQDSEAALQIILRNTQSYFGDRVDTNDLEILTFCLQQLFACGSRLFYSMLPDLTTCLIRQEEMQQTQDVLTTYCIWTQLQVISCLLARMESLCHLINSSVLGMLDTLDITCLSSTNTASDVTPTPLVTPYPSLEQSKGDRLQSYIISDQQWQDALKNITQHLQHWKKNNQQRASFSDYFTIENEPNNNLIELDNSFHLLLEDISLVFGTILPGFRNIGIGDDTPAATLLLDLVQKADLVQFHVSSQQEPLHQLMQQHAQGSSVQ